jgi:starch synthase (maltosyl-transferring)
VTTATCIPDFYRRVAIDRIIPDVDGGRFAAKRLVDQPVVISADIVCDGHDELACFLHVRPLGSAEWTSLRMTCAGNDRWSANFTPGRVGAWEYTVSGQVDNFATWLRDLALRDEAGDDLTAEFAEGRELIQQRAAQTSAPLAAELQQLARKIKGKREVAAAQDTRLASLMQPHPTAGQATWLERPRRLWVDRERAAWGAWYEAFPRSWGSPERHGSLTDLASQLGYIAGMGFNVLYLPPIHPIGKSFRKGKNNSLKASPDDVGSPWGVGSAEGGHTAIHPELGTLADFETLRQEAARNGLEIALDLALQCSPDHPWVTEHPEWFRQRVDGSIRYAENPPKKYQDIYPLNFETASWQSLWEEIHQLLLFWIGRGVRIFRVDNPHTKPFDFWEWLIDRIHATHPDVIFLAEAFTRPKTMYRLAKIGFSQSYTYFTWRTEKKELGRYLEEVASPPTSDFFRPNFFTNTPDILHASLQEGGRPMFMVRLALAALSAGNWGIYGPAMELQAATPLRPGSEEYLDSEKYELKNWDRDHPDNLAPFITRLNEIRESEPALRRLDAPLVQRTNDEHLLAWCRYDPASGSRVLVVVNLKPGERRRGVVTLDKGELELTAEDAIEARHLVEGNAVRVDHTTVEITCTPSRPVVVLRLVRAAIQLTFSETCDE